MALGIIKYFNEIGVSIPQRIAVLGFNNWFMSSVISPKLSTINQPGFEIQRSFVSILFDENNSITNNKTINYKSIKLQGSLI